MKLSRKNISIVLFFIVMIFVVSGCSSKGVNDSTKTNIESINKIMEEKKDNDLSEITTSEDTSKEDGGSNLKEYTIGDSIKFGGYEWLILDVRDEKALLLTKEIIGIKYGNISKEAEEGLNNLAEEKMKYWELKDFENFSIFDSKYDGIYDAFVEYKSKHPEIFNRDMWYSSWKNCSLRKWLNSEMDFTSNEWDKIELTEISDKAGIGENTLDKVFLLDNDDILKYFPRNESRGATCIASDEELLDFMKHSLLLGSLSGAITEKTLNIKNDGIFPWWVRSSDNEEIYIKPMSTDEDLGDIAPSPKKSLGVRPAIWVDINN